MKSLIMMLCLFSGILACSNTTKMQFGNANPINHEAFTKLLQKYVDDTGKVNYKGFIKEKEAFSEYLNLLTDNKPTGKWTKNAQIAYWINVYNAFTIKLIADNYPVNSIKDIKNGIPFVNTVWDIKFIEFADEKMDLNKVEHGILRKHFDEPRIHFAVNCASYSCPRLLNEAFEAETLEEQLSKMTKDFLADERKNIITNKHLQLSKIFSWFKGDFTKKSSLIEFLNKYAPTQIDKNATIEHLNYSWDLNDK